ncbi:MAG TPA: DUF222 domain-containing protein [Acidimicrobiia bacterium]|nr:DUF222 domain-containing protein [Acidimicrobiia bacterium]
MKSEHGPSVPLDELLPGPELAARLGAIDLDSLSGYDRVDFLRAAHRMLSHVQAQAYAAVAAIADHMEDSVYADRLEVAWDATATEIRAALRLTRRSAEAELEMALDIHRRLPAVGAALSDGRIDHRRARTIVRGTSHLDRDTARAVVDTVLETAPQLTTGQLAERLRRLCVEVDPEAAQDRYEDAVEERRIVLEASPDGTAGLLGLDLPPDRAAEAADNINRLAMSLDGDDRSVDQRRADVFLDLLTGSRRDTRGGTVQLRVDLGTLAGLAEAPGDLNGFGPVIADISRQVADAQRDGEWRFTITDPDTGLPVHDGTTRRRPTAAQRRTVEARDAHCVFPGCRMPASACDLDHRTPWAVAQRTSSADMAPGCRYDHVTVRHGLGWRYVGLPNGDYLWISPLGHEYTTSGRSP